MSTTRPASVQILRWHRMVGVGGQFGFHLTLLHEHTRRTSTVEFIGSVYGVPGPILMRLQGGIQTWVDFPERFGDTFGREWIRRFYGLDTTPEVSA